MVDTKQQEIGRKLGELKKLNQYVTLSHVPALPRHFVKNEFLFNEIKTKLLAKSSDEQRAPIVLQGISGMGKSVMAAALGHDTDIQHAFSDGIFWLRLCADADLLERQVALVSALDGTIDFVDIEAGAERLRKLCATRFCLVILDDVLDAGVLSAFNFVGQHCQVLITTHDKELLEFAQYFMTALGYEIKPFTEQQAVEFFSHCVDVTDVNLVRACDYSPLILKLMGNVASQWDSSELIERLQDDDYEYLEAEAERLDEHLLAAYRRQCGQHGWVSGPNDGYFFEYLCMHLHSAGRDNELKLLLLDFDWIRNKLEATSVLALLNDYEWLEDTDLERVKNVLSRGALVLLKNKQELATQLLENLWGDKSLQDNKNIQALLNQAKELVPDWQPAFPTFNE
ncbi:hypothetical protein PN36_11900 [Candidatus Thiomargarita nelsonii]|uniref:NB-ARC domain-containing protein n=1 Tax=Candidatus Thiomargarita nelsonii TaxID=1003181 RepID=A0A0A6RNI9_9GAMM|nr:hypothetical protein PN36_11900 [Candidatus Thiomargarita nelsonii]